MKDLIRKVSSLISYNTDKLADYKPVRSYGGDIQIGDFVELYKVVEGERYGDTFDYPCKYVGTVTSIEHTNRGYYIVQIEYFYQTKTRESDEYRIDNRTPWIEKTEVRTLLKELTYTKSNNSPREGLQTKVCKIESFKAENKINKEYQELITSFKNREKAVMEEKERIKREEEEKKRALKKAEEEYRKKEDARRAVKMEITVGMWEDLMRRIERIEYNVDD